MKKVLTFAFVIVVINSYGQSRNEKAKKTASGLQMTEAIIDSIPVEYIHKTNHDHNPAFFVNGKFLSGSKNINPDQIKSMNVVHKDTTINGKKYYGQIYLKIKRHHSSYDSSLITLRRLADIYTKLKNKPVLFTIDGKVINTDYSNYKVDKNSILKIVVEKFDTINGSNKLWLVNILTKTEKNIKKSKQMIIRGSSEIVRK